MLFLSIIWRGGTAVLGLLTAACWLGAKISPQWFSYSSLCSLIFPYAYLLLLVWGVAMLFLSWKNAIFAWAILVMGYTSFGIFFVFPSSTSHPLPEKKIRVLSWNVGSFSFQKTKYTSEKKIAEAFAKVIEEADPDVICLQEVWVSYPKENWLDQFSKAKGFPYLLYAKNTGVSHKPKSSYQGAVILSKVPIINKKPIQSSLHHQLLDATILHPRTGKKMTIFNVHLQSNKINAELIQQIKELNIHDEQSLQAAASFADKLAINSQIRYHQIEEINAIADRLSQPSIFCVDLNDVGASYNYHKLSHDRLDAFKEKGAWFRFTFPLGLTSVGIDFIFSEQNLPPLSYQQISSDLSDHLPHYADF